MVPRDVTTIESVSRRLQTRLAPSRRCSGFLVDQVLKGLAEVGLHESLSYRGRSPVR